VGGFLAVPALIRSALCLHEILSLGSECTIHDRGSSDKDVTPLVAMSSGEEWGFWKLQPSPCREAIIEEPNAHPISGVDYGWPFAIRNSLPAVHLMAKTHFASRDGRDGS